MAHGQEQLSRHRYCSEAPLEEHGSTYRYSDLFFFSVICLICLQSVLSWQRKTVGLWGWSLGSGLGVTEQAHPILAFGCVVLAFLASCGLTHYSLLWYKRERPEGEMWPSGSLRNLGGHQILSIIVISMLLSRIPQNFQTNFTLLFLAGLLLVLRSFRLFRTDISRCKRELAFLYGLRLSWLTVLCSSHACQEPRTLSVPMLVFALSGWVLAFCSQGKPSLSFSYCFLRKKTDAPTLYQGMFWIGRMERVIIGVGFAFLFSIFGKDALVLVSEMGLFFFTRVLLNGVQKTLEQDPKSRAELVGQKHLYSCQNCLQHFPDSASFLAHSPLPPFADTLDVKGLQNRPRPMVTFQPKILTVEVLATFGLLFLSVAWFGAWTLSNYIQLRSNSAYSSATDRIRVFPGSDHFYVVHKNISMSEKRLLESSLQGCQCSWNKKIDVSQELDANPYIAEVSGPTYGSELKQLLAATFCLLSLLGLSCFHNRGWLQPKPLRLSHLTIPGGILGTLAIGSVLGWIWISQTLTVSAFILFLVISRLCIYKVSRPNPKEVRLRVLRARRQFRSLLKEAELPCLPDCRESLLMENMLGQEILTLELGRAIFQADAFDKGSETLTKRLRKLEEVSLQTFGIAIPHIKIVRQLELVPIRYTIKLRETAVATNDLQVNKLFLCAESKDFRGIYASHPVTGETGMWISPEQVSYAKEKKLATVDPTTLLLQHLIWELGPRISTFLSRQEVHRLLNRAATDNKLLTQKVRKLYPLGTLQKILKAVLNQGYSLAEHEIWLSVLCKNVGSVEELTTKVSEALERRIKTPPSPAPTREQ